MKARSASSRSIGEVTKGKQVQYSLAHPNIDDTSQAEWKMFELMERTT
ncbi:unnamed protein product [Angiostrongylus costaricensis]|uniref:Kinesin motor domain-containing protein n=1 Tax=Angiostrongylus costaricensis TaxID=334426 RepID=A0A0R3PC19_ANGCS|nr:unnamed protein product [Angiostrongylus costaricensis]